MKFSAQLHSGLLAVVGLVQLCWALEIDTSDQESIYAAQALVAKGLLDYYDGYRPGGVVGMFVSPYYWWEAGVAWGSLLDYTYYTQNDTYADLIKQAMLYQTGDNWNYMPTNQTVTEGNDDQGFWGVTVMAAAEKNFSAPSSGEPSWEYLAQAVFNTMAARWDTQHCNGGLRWQIFTWNAGYDYKNSVSNGCLFHLAARLARYLGNDTYIEWANKTWDWMEQVGYMSNVAYNGGPPSNTMLYIYDGSYIADNCSDVRTLEWTYNSGLFLSGCAYLYNHTGHDIWLDRAQRIWNRARVFFNNSIMYEAACQPSNRCNTDQLCFKGIFSRFLGLTLLMAPSLREQIWPNILASANAAAASCSGGEDGHTCGFNWFVNGWDGTWGLGQQINVLDLFNTLLIDTMPPPLSVQQGASNQTDPNAGLNSSSSSPAGEAAIEPLKLDAGDKAGAGVATAAVALGLLLSSWWLLK